MAGYIKSPLNYTGGKYKILDYIIPMFPKNIETFIDLFGGGFDMGINVDAKKIIYNDHNLFLAEMFEYFRKKGLNVIEEIKSVINKYELSEENSEGYLKLRSDYNKNKNIVDLFVLTCYSFNHQIRFNSKREFNTPFGKNRSSYNKTIEKNLSLFIENLQKKNIEFYSKDFLSLNIIRSLKKNDFVYCDPPYLISKASYNDGTRGFKIWSEKEESELYNLLDSINKQGIKFALSNVLVHKGMENECLKTWSKKYKVKKIEKNYNNSSYQRKNKNTETQEVLIYNY